MITKQTAIEQLEMYREKLQSKFTNVNVQALSIGSQSFVLPKNPENNWNHVEYHLQIFKQGGAQVYFKILHQECANPNEPKRIPTIYVNYYKGESSKEMSINGKIFDGKFDHDKPIDLQLLDIAKVLNKRKII